MDKYLADKLPDQQNQSYIKFALGIAKKNIGITAPNPSVGCVLVKNGAIISTGVTGQNGTPHAETVAIEKAGKNSIGATLYVTLEPCSHFGKTPPCVDLIIKSKISKVIIACVDPDSRVNGEGIKKLQEAKIEVVVGILEDEARKLNQGFFGSRTKKMPFVTLKLATSLDGKIATKNGDSKWITSEQSRQFGHYLRAKNDAILVGASTVKADDPMLDCRINSLEKYSPKRFILSSKLDIALESRIVQTAKQIPTYILTNSSDTQRFIDAGVNIINFENSNDKIDPKILLTKICEIGVNNLLIEGGAKLATQFLKADLVDRLIWIQSPKIVGGDGVDAVADLDLSKIEQSLKFKITRTKKIDEDLLVELEKKI
ncbi:MAG: ribD [Rickettsiaceae bacterium]|jgi:diaminohydroxyphosphoribosylaminopyrimidine deaminase/5-amino-6-(5-phosphoribosylamino)uracil reductase|nr:ribD [Rickettsiaceae bacterium]